MILIGCVAGFEVAPRTVLFLVEADPYLYTLICVALPHFSGLRYGSYAVQSSAHAPFVVIAAPVEMAETVEPQ